VRPADNREEREGLLLRIMEIVEEAGSSLAFPSQTVHLADDREPARAPDPVVAEADLRVRT
jgi:small-conductance mechanosensitive channel